MAARFGIVQIETIQVQPSIKVIKFIQLTKDFCPIQPVTQSSMPPPGLPHPLYDELEHKFRYCITSSGCNSLNLVTLAAFPVTAPFAISIPLDTAVPFASEYVAVTIDTLIIPILGSFALPS